MLRSLLRIRPFVAPYKWRLVAGIAAFGVARLFEATIPFLLGMGIDRLADGSSDLALPAYGIFGAVVMRYLVVTYARLSVRKVGLYVASDLRRQLYASLQQQGLQFFNSHTVGDMMTRAVADIALIQRLISMGTILFVIMIYATIVGFGFMIYMSPELTLLLIPPLPFVYYYAKHSARNMGIASQDVQDRLSDLGTHVQENLSGIRTIQAMAQEENEMARFAKTNHAYARAFYIQARVNSLMTSYMPTFAAVCTMTILAYGGNLVLQGEMSVGHFTAFFMYVNMIVQPFRVAGFMVNLFQRAGVASDRLHEVIDLDPEVPDQQSGSTPVQIAGRIQLNDLHLSYDTTRATVLNGVDLDVAAGETIAVMGKVGAGKTSLLRSIVRLVDPPAGSVITDGHDARHYPLAQLRAQAAMVPQEPFLFGETLQQNLTYDDPTRSLDEIWAAAEAADLKGTIEGFPEGLDTLVGERGVTLSGGQKQRATLARGLIRHAPILLLDDCFSSVDTETEEHILSELQSLRKGQTTLIVSHRVSTARHADRIIVLDGGRITEVGSHEELLASGGWYADLERIQREGAVEGDFDGLEATT